MKKKLIIAISVTVLLLTVGAVALVIRLSTMNEKAIEAPSTLKSGEESAGTQGDSSADQAAGETGKKTTDGTGAGNNQGRLHGGDAASGSGSPQGDNGGGSAPNTTGGNPAAPDGTDLCPGAPNTPGGEDPWGGCWPGPNNTGIAGCPALTAYTGTVWAGDGDVVENMLIYGQLRVPGMNATVRCVKVVTASEYFPVDTDYSARTNAAQATLDRVEIDCGGSQMANAAIDLRYATLTRARVYGCPDAFRNGSHSVIADSYCGDLFVDGDDDNSWHYDCAQTTGGTNMTLRHNTFVGKDTSDIALWPDVTSIDTVLVERNLLLGNVSYKIYVGGNGRSTTNVTVRQNYFGPGGYGPCTIVNAAPTWIGNAWVATGASLPVNLCI
jgi:hypothetical protein